MYEKLDTKYKIIQEMTDVKEMATEDLMNEAVSRAIDANCKLILAAHEAYRRTGSQTSPEVQSARRAKTENEMRLHAVRAELIVRGVDWIDGYDWTKQEGGLHA